jgi:hypothetical protein
MERETGLEQHLRPFAEKTYHIGPQKKTMRNSTQLREIEHQICQSISHLLSILEKTKALTVTLPYMGPLFGVWMKRNVRAGMKVMAVMIAIYFISSLRKCGAMYL